MVVIFKVSVELSNFLSTSNFSRLKKKREGENRERHPPKKLSNWFFKAKRGQSACVRVYESERERVGMKNDDKEKDEKSECVREGGRGRLPDIKTEEGGIFFPSHRCLEGV